MDLKGRPALVCASTGGLGEAVARALAAEGADIVVSGRRGVPGRIATDRVAQLDQGAAEKQGLSVDEVEAKSKATIPAGRYGRPAEFGAVAAFLCSDLASYVTGTALRCDGGLVRSL